MEEKRTCTSCGARLRPGTRFCSACGAIVRNTPKPESVESTTEVKPVNHEPVKNNHTPHRHPNYNSENNEVYYYERPQKSKEPKKEVSKQYRTAKESFSFELAGDNFHLWNALTAATGLIPLVLGIVLLCLNFMSVTYEGYNMSLSMSDCFDVLFARDVPIFYEITKEIGGMCSLAAISALFYVIFASGQVLYNLIVYGRYDKKVLLINTIFSAVLTLLAVLLVISYVVMMNTCNTIAGVSNYSTFAIIFAIITTMVLILDVVKLTILYQKKVAALERPSYALDFISKLGKQIWKLICIISGSLVGVALIIIVLLSTSKSPVIKVWENYVNAFNSESTTAISECYFPLDSEENKNMQNIYKAIFDAEGSAVLGKGEAKLILRTEKYITVQVKGSTLKQASGETVKLSDLKLHFGKVKDKWYLMSKVELEEGGNKISINKFNQDASSTLLKINDTTLRGFSLKVSRTDASKITELVVPEGVTKIEEGAFKGLVNLKTVVLPNSIEKIDANAFKGCTSLETVQLGEKITYLGESTFEGCESLKEIVLPLSLSTIEKHAFKDCANLTIYTYYNEQPIGYDTEWNSSSCKVYLESQWSQNESNPERINILVIESNGGEFDLLDEDEYYKNNEVARLPLPSKLGCEFLGWYTTPDFQENTKLTTNTVSMNTDVTVYAKWNENVYTIKYELNGGTLSDSKNTYTVEDNFVLGMPVKEGYTFEGWLGTGIDGNKPVENVTIKNATGNREYTAVFTPNEYTITLDANGGEGVESIIAKFDSDIQLTNKGTITYQGMILVGWNTEADGSGKTYKPNQVINYKETSDITLYAMWTSLITLDAGEHGKVEGEIPRIIENQQKYQLPIPTTDEYLFFVGWYVGTQQITNENGEGLATWVYNEAVTLRAEWSDVLIRDGIRYYYRGVYPQTRVTDEKIITALSRKTTTDARGYYELNGSYYAKVKYTDYSTIAYFNDGTQLKHDTTYFFKVEKVLWRLLDTKENIAITEYVLDSMPFYDNNRERTYYDPKAGADIKVYPNDFSESVIHKFLNDGMVNRHNLVDELKELNYESKGFLSLVFGDSTKLDAVTTFEEISKYILYQLSVDNSEASTLVPGNQYSSYYTKGYFFPLSRKQYEKDFAEGLKGGVAYATDYAIAKEVTCDRNDKAKAKASTWWLRSPYHDSSKEAFYIDVNGTVNHALVTDAKVGLRPACVFLFDED